MVRQAIPPVVLWDEEKTKKVHCLLHLYNTNKMLQKKHHSYFKTIKLKINLHLILIFYFYLRKKWF